MNLFHTSQLVTAVEHNDTVTAICLLAAGANANARAPFSDEDSSAKTILDRMSERSSKDGPPLLLTAARVRNVELVRALLAHGANANVQDISGHPHR